MISGITQAGLTWRAKRTASETSRDADHLLGRDLVADELRHRRLDEAGAQRERLDALGVELLVHRLRPAHDRELRGAVDRQPRLAGLAGDRRGVDHERVAVLGAGAAQHVGALAVEEDDRAQVEVDLHVDLLRRVLGDRRADPDARVVDQHVEAAEALAVLGDDVLDLLLGGHVGRDLLDVVARFAQLQRGAGQLVGPPRGDREAVALLAEHVRDREPDAARGAGDEGCAVGHGGGTYTLSGDEHSVHGLARPARAPSRRGFRVRRRGALRAAGAAHRRPLRRPRSRRRSRPSPRGSRRSAGCASRRVRAPPRSARRRRSATGSRTSTAPTRRRSAAPTRRCSSCSGCSSRRSTCGTSRRRSSARASRATTTRARSACGSSRAPRPPTASSTRSRSPTSSPTRSRTSASGSTSRTRRAPTTRRSPGSRWSRAAPPR